MSTLAGFLSAFFTLYRRFPSKQEIFDEGVREGKARATPADHVPVNRNRPSDMPGGCECMACGCIFIGGPFHAECGVCATPADHGVRDAALFGVLMRRNIEITDEAYLSLRVVGVPPSEEEFVSAIKRALTTPSDR